MQRIISMIAVLGFAGLSACGELDSDLERAAVGGVIGCAAGEVLVDGRCLEGAVVGAGVGVLTND